VTILWSYVWTTRQTFAVHAVFRPASNLCRHGELLMVTVAERGVLVGDAVRILIEVEALKER
jgi:hypothetical protein